MEHIALIMKRGKLSQKDINAFHREMERARIKIKEMAQ